MILEKNQKSEARNGPNRSKKYIPTVPLRGAFCSAASGPADRRRTVPAAQSGPSLKNGCFIRNFFQFFKPKTTFLPNFLKPIYFQTEGPKKNLTSKKNLGVWYRSPGSSPPPGGPLQIVVNFEGTLMLTAPKALDT